MKISILNESKQSLGGGWTFIRNFKKGIELVSSQMFRNGQPIGEIPTIVEDWREADIVFIPAATMASRDTVSIIKGTDKKVVLRLDNIPRNSRNRGSGTTRLYDITQMADAVIYQSEWSRGYLMPFVEKYGDIVYNGVDTDIYHPNGLWNNLGGDVTVLYSRYSRDETKGWERAWYDFQMIHRQCKKENKTAKLILVGRFSDELRNYNFDFYNGEDIEYLGVIDDDERMARTMRGCDILLAPYYNDCYSNTIQEAMACGLEIQTEMSGGTPEIFRNGVISLEKMVASYLNKFNELL